jgi:hypothetical protein
MYSSQVRVQCNFRAILSIAGTDGAVPILFEDLLCQMRRPFAFGHFYRNLTVLLAIFELLLTLEYTELGLQLNDLLFEGLLRGDEAVNEGD